MRHRHCKTLSIAALEKASRLQVAAEMRRKGKNLAEIGEVLKLSKATISKMLTQHRMELIARADQDIKAWIAELIGEYEAVAREAWIQFERSKLDKERREDDGSKVKVITEGQCGDPAYLSRIMEAMAHIRSILGTDAPKRSEVEATMGVVRVSEEIIARREDPTTPSASQILGQPGDAAGLCGGTGDGEVLCGVLRPAEASEAGPDVSGGCPDVPHAS